MERRFLNQATAKVSVEKRDDEAPKIVGLASVFYDGTPNTEYELWPGAVERVLPTAFDRALADGDDARGLFNHDPNMLLGRNSAGTLTLRKTTAGLGYEINAPDTVVGRDTVTSIDRGDLSGSSFSFVVQDQDWVTEETSEGRTLEVRNIKQVRLFDVGPVTFPAFEATTTGTRSHDSDEAKASYDAWKLREARKIQHQAGIQARAIEVDHLTSEWLAP